MQFNGINSSSTAEFNLEPDKPIDEQLKAIYERDPPSELMIRNGKYSNSTPITHQVSSYAADMKIDVADDARVGYVVLDGDELNRATMHTPDENIKRADFGSIVYENKYDSSDDAVKASNNQE